MKLLRIECDECGGSGRCQCCGGDGQIARPLILQRLPDDFKHENAAELLALRDDIKRCEQQADAMIKLLPDRESSYRSQLQACIADIERPADELI